MTINLAASPPCDRKTIVCEILLFVFGREIEELKRFAVDGIWHRSYASNAQINRFFPKRINEDEMCRELNCKVFEFFVHSHKLTSFTAFELLHYESRAHSWYHNNVLERRNAKLMAIDHILHKFSGPLSSRRRFNDASSMR